MAIIDTVKPFLFSILLICGGIVSIGISAWQFQNIDNGVDYVNLESGDTMSLEKMCKTFPYNWMRPFKMNFDNYDDAACGYSEANTGYRLALACATVIGGALLIWYRTNEDTKVATYWGLFVVSILWYAASVADIIALVQGTEGCIQSYQKYNDFITCDSAQYGITIAVDVLMSVLLCLCWVLAGRESGDAVFAAPGAAAAARPSLSSSASAPPARAEPLDRF